MANSASAMPGATTASDVFFEAAIERNEVMMPHTVPNRPTKGPAEATDASTSSCDSSRSTSRRDRHVEHLLDPRLQAHEGRGRACREGALPLAHGRDEEGRHAGVGRLRQRLVEILERVAGPEASSNRSIGFLELPEQNDLVDDDRPAPDRGAEQADITIFTTKCADQNMRHRETSVATSFIGGPSSPG